jgi:hypothetical protein
MTQNYIAGSHFQRDEDLLSHKPHAQCTATIVVVAPNYKPKDERSLLSFPGG